MLPLIALRNGNNIMIQKIYYSIINTTSLPINYLVLIIGLVMFLISLMISLHIYDNKEF